MKKLTLLIVALLVVAAGNVMAWDVQVVLEPDFACGDSTMTGNLWHNDIGQAYCIAGAQVEDYPGSVAIARISCGADPNIYYEASANTTPGYQEVYAGGYLPYYYDLPTPYFLYVFMPSSADPVLAGVKLDW